MSCCGFTVAKLSLPGYRVGTELIRPMYPRLLLVALGKPRGMLGLNYDNLHYVWLSVTMYG